jgi:hypothetical protein
MRDYGAALADGIEAALPGWVEACVSRVMAGARRPMDDEVRTLTATAGLQARDEVGPKVRALLDVDIDEQATTPLAIIRSTAVRYPTEVLQRAGVPPSARDAFAVSAFPDDLYDLAPASFADLSPGLAEAGLAWGAAKAFEHKRRHAR